MNLALHLAGAVGLCVVVAYGKPTTFLRERVSSLFGCPYCLATWIGPVWGAALAAHWREPFGFVIAFGFAAALAAFLVACIARGFEIANESVRIARSKEHRRAVMHGLDEDDDDPDVEVH